MLIPAGRSPYETAWGWNGHHSHQKKKEVQERDHWERRWWVFLLKHMSWNCNIVYGIPPSTTSTKFASRLVGNCWKYFVWYFSILFGIFNLIFLGFDAQFNNSKISLLHFIAFKGKKPKASFLASPHRHVSILLFYVSIAYLIMSNVSFCVSTLALWIRNNGIYWNSGTERRRRDAWRLQADSTAEVKEEPGTSPPIHAKFRLINN